MKACKMLCVIASKPWLKLSIFYFVLFYQIRPTICSFVRIMNMMRWKGLLNLCRGDDSPNLTSHDVYIERAVTLYIYHTSHESDPI